MAINEISMALASFKTAIEIIKSISNKTKDINLKGKIIELQGLIISFQSEYSTLLDVKNQLEKKLVEYEDWDKTKSQYELKEVAPSVFVYVSKKNDKLSEPEHWLCTNCFGDRKRSILQKHISSRPGYYSCPKCRTAFHIPIKKKDWPKQSFKPK